MITAILLLWLAAGFAGMVWTVLHMAGEELEFAILSPSKSLRVR